MRLPIWAVLLTVTTLICLVGAVMFLLGRNSVSEPQASAVLEAETNAVPDPARLAAKKVVGSWALADTGCATDYGATYTTGGRFSEGDAGSGIEGRWAIENGELARRNERQFSTDDWFSEPTVNATTGTDRFSIVSLTATGMVFKDNRGEQFSYVRCHEGQHKFLDGEVAEAS